MSGRVDRPKRIKLLGIVAALLALLGLAFAIVYPNETVGVVCVAAWLLITGSLALLPWLQRDPYRQRRKQGRCVRCGYDVRGNTSGRCPECGESIGVAVERTPEELADDLKRVR